jgi:DNA/RNA endonuclease G (NUC1)
MENVRNYDGQNYKDTDDRGHLIGHQFGGSDRLENLIPQDAKINENDFRFFEAELAKAVSDGKEVYVVIEPVYEDDTNRRQPLS